MTGGMAQKHRDLEKHVLCDSRCLLSSREDRSNLRKQMSRHSRARWSATSAPRGPVEADRCVLTSLSPSFLCVQDLAPRQISRSDPCTCGRALPSLTPILRTKDTRTGAELLEHSPCMTVCSS